MAGSLAYEARSADEAVEYVRKIAEDRPDMIKLMITGGVLDAKVRGEPGVLKMPPEYVRACCDEAHKLGFKVAAHVESPEGVRVALENGVDSIEHGPKPNDEIIELFKSRGAYLVTTISPALPYALFDRSVSHASEMEQFNGSVVFKGIIDCTAACLENGIPVGLGTDTGCPYITHYDMWRELHYYHKYCGVSNAFALYSATLQNARLLGIEDVTGSIERGKCADFIVIEGNPLEDLDTLRNVSMVTASIAAISLEAFKHKEFILPLVLICIAGAVITYWYNIRVCRVLFPDYSDEAFLSLYGMSFSKARYSAAVRAIRGVAIRSTAGSLARFEKTTVRSMAPVRRKSEMKYSDSSKVMPIAAKTTAKVSLSPSTFA